MSNYPGPLQDFSIITEDGVEHPIFATNTIHFVGLDGVGLPLINRILEKAPLQNGMTDRGFRLDVRRMILTLMLEGDTAADTDDYRDEIAYILSPTNSPITLKATRDDGVTKYIDCFVDGMVDFPMSQRTGGGQPIIANLVAPDPTWYNIEQQEDSVTLIDGSVTIDLTVTGLWDDWPIIDITGPVDSGFLFARTPGANGLITVAAIPAGETYRFDLRPGYKSVRRTSDSANRMDVVDPSLLQEFSLMQILGEKTMKALDPSWGNAYNRWTFIATGTTGASNATIRWYQRYISL